MKTILVDAVDTFVSEDGVIDQEMHELLEQYPNPKIIVTNANDEQMIQFGLDKVPYEVFTMKHNPDKPDPLFFGTLLEEKGLEADTVVYFEHNLDAVNTAQSLGIQSYHFDHIVRDMDSLKIFIDENIEN
jgi:HAD superfamily hydrolase (TIGR01509 family)